MVDLPLPAAERVARYRSIIPDWDAFLEALQRPLPLCLWTNTLRTDVTAVRRQLSVEAIEGRRVGWYPGAFKGPPSDRAGQSLPFVGGLYHIQEEVSLVPVVLLDPRPGERILDLCAAPGNKTAQMAVAMRNTGTIVANDRSAIRMRATRGTLDRLGVINTTITTAEAEQFPEAAGLFDRVLLDAPCTCEGTSRKNVSAFVASGRDRSKSLQKQQIAMLRKAVALCRPGGRIVYSTCTYAPEENELVVEAALQEFGSTLQLRPARIDGLTSSPGITRWDGRALSRSVEKAIRIWPHQNDTGGFFVAVFEKAGVLTDHDGNTAAGAKPSTARRSANSPYAQDAAGTATASENDSDVSGSRARWIGLLHARFGIPGDVFADWSFSEPNRKYLFVTPNDHDPPGKPEPISDGMPLIRTALRYPKLTTAGVRLIGRHASRNVVDMSVEQTEAYVSREDFVATSDQANGIESTGYVLVAHRGVLLGVGIFFEDDRRVASMFPKVLARTVNLPIPG